MTHKGYKRQVERVQELERKVREIQSKVGEVTTQTSETWHDNAPYSILVEELRLADRRFADALNEMSQFRIMEYPREVGSKVAYGTKVELYRDSKKETLTIVGHEEGNFEKGEISYLSPLGRALVGKKVGDFFMEKIHEKTQMFKILGVYPIENNS